MLYPPPPAKILPPPAWHTPSLDNFRKFLPPQLKLGGTDSAGRETLACDTLQMYIVLSSDDENTNPMVAGYEDLESDEEHVFNGQLSVEPEYEDLSDSEMPQMEKENIYGASEEDIVLGGTSDNIGLESDDESMHNIIKATEVIDIESSCPLEDDSAISIQNTPSTDQFSNIATVAPMTSIDTSHDESSQVDSTDSGPSLEVVDTECSVTSEYTDIESNHSFMAQSASTTILDESSDDENDAVNTMVMGDIDIEDDLELNTSNAFVMEDIDIEEEGESSVVVAEDIDVNENSDSFDESVTLENGVKETGEDVSLLRFNLLPYIEFQLQLFLDQNHPFNTKL